jgi:hypothetical protein
MSRNAAAHVAPTRPQSRGTAPLSDAQKVQRIRAVVGKAGLEARERHAWLAHQNAIGLFIQLGSVAGMALCAWLYLQGSLPWWATVPLVAMLAAFTHEMEHDLIHQMYFKDKPWVQDALLLIGWIARPSTINPWVRRELHFHHHKVSGHQSDMEERSITNGEPWGLKRFLMLADSMLSIVLRPKTIFSIAGRYIREADKPANGTQATRAIAMKVLSYAPLGHLCWGTWHAFVLFHAVDLIGTWSGHPVAWHPMVLNAMPVVNALTVCLVGPNVLRTFCLHFVSSNMHYYGDIEKGNVMQQCQVLNHPLFWPVQLFCFNFGSTHAIHHFVVGQPFYLRQMIAAEAHAVMREVGVRFNDLGTFKRANRWGAWAPALAR